MLRTTAATRRRVSTEQQEVVILSAHSQVQALTTLRVVIGAIINSLLSVLCLKEAVEVSVRRGHKPLFIHVPHYHSFIPVRRHHITN